MTRKRTISAMMCQLQQHRLRMRRGQATPAEMTAQIAPTSAQRKTRAGRGRGGALLAAVLFCAIAEYAYHRSRIVQSPGAVLRLSYDRR